MSRCASSPPAGQCLLKCQHQDHQLLAGPLVSVDLRPGVQLDGPPPPAAPEADVVDLTAEATQAGASPVAPQHEARLAPGAAPQPSVAALPALPLRLAAEPAVASTSGGVLGGAWPGQVSSRQAVMAAARAAAARRLAQWPADALDSCAPPSLADQHSQQKEAEAQQARERSMQLDQAALRALSKLATPLYHSQHREQQVGQAESPRTVCSGKQHARTAPASPGRRPNPAPPPLPLQIALRLQQEQQQQQHKPLRGAAAAATGAQRAAEGGPKVQLSVASVLEAPDAETSTAARDDVAAEESELSEQLEGTALHEVSPRCTLGGGGGGGAAGVEGSTWQHIMMCPAFAHGSCCCCGCAGCKSCPRPGWTPTAACCRPTVRVPAKHANGARRCPRALRTPVCAWVASR